MQIILTREHISVPWGFRLKGGAEYNVPLSILKVNEGSPSHFKLECGDVIASIGNFSALNLKHEEALNIIRMFDVSLPLVVHRDQSINFNQQYKSPQTWRPQSVSSSNVVKSINSYLQNNSYSPASSSPNNISYHHHINSPNNYSSQLSYNNNGVAIISPASPAKTQYSFLNQHTTNVSPSYLADNQTPSHAYNVNHPHTLIEVQQNTNSSINQLQLPPPPAPPLPSTGFVSPNSYRTNQNQANTKNNTASDESASVSSYSASKQLRHQNVPDALLKAMNGPGMGKKPFTYTPGGLDLSHVRESARVKRYEAMQNLEHHSATLNRQSSFNQPHHYNQQTCHSYHSNNIMPSSPYQRHSSLARNTSASISNLSTFERDNSLSSVTREHVPHSSEIAPSKINNSPTNFYENKVNNDISTTPKIPISSTLAKKVSNHYNQPTGGFTITPDQLVKPKRDENRDLMNQSFSFKMLNRWIEESESNNISLKSKKDEEEKEKESEKEKAALRKSEVAKAIEEEEHKSMPSNVLGKQQYHQVHSPKVQTKFSSQPAYHVPSRVFQYVDRKFSTNNDESSISKDEKKRLESNDDQFNLIKIPAREREQETGPSKYRGTNIPSRSFKYLQYLTDNEVVIDNSNLNNSISQNASSSSYSASSFANNNATSSQLNSYHQQEPNISPYKTLSDQSDSPSNKIENKPASISSFKDSNSNSLSAFDVLEKSNSPPNQNLSLTPFNSKNIGVNSVTFAQPLQQTNTSTPNPDLLNPQLLPIRSSIAQSYFEPSNLISTNNSCTAIDLSSNSNSEFINDNDSSDTVVDTALAVADSIADTPITYSTANDLVEAIAIELNASKPNTITAQNKIDNDELNAYEALSADVANISSELTNSIEFSSSPLIKSFSSNNDLININKNITLNENNENLNQQNDKIEYSSSFQRETKQDEVEVTTMKQEQDINYVSPETTASTFENSQENTQNLVNVVGEVFSNVVNTNLAIRQGQIEATASSQYYENLENNEIETSEF